MYKYIYPLIKWKIKPWLKYYIVKSSGEQGTLSEIIEGTSPLTLENSIRKKFNIFNVKGNTIQNGEPTPETPIPIENVSGEVEVKVENKNVYNASLAMDKKYQNYGGNYWTITSHNGFWCTGLQKIKPNTRYVVNIQNFYVKVFYTKNKEPIKQIISGYTFVSPEDAFYVNFCFDRNTIPFGSDFQIEEGSTATSYEPHEEQTAILHLPEGMEMCKIGDYKDSFVEQGGKWYKKKEISKLIINENTEMTTNQSGRFDIPIENTKFGSLSSPNAISNYYKSRFEITNNSIYISGAFHWISIMDNRFTSVNNFKDFAISNNLKIYYVQNIFTLEEITDPTLISDLNNLKNLYSYKGTTHISSSNEPSPVFEVQYYMKGN